MFCPISPKQQECITTCAWYDKLDDRCMLITIRNNIVDIHIRMARREEEDDE